MATRTDEPLIVKEGGLEKDDAVKAEQIRTDIAATRNHMARTVDAIEERLSPKHIKEQVSSVKQHLIEELKDAKSTIKGEVQEEIVHVKDKVQEEIAHVKDTVKTKVRAATVGRVENMVHGARSTMTHAGSTTVDTVKTNPIPAAMIAVGLGWLIVSGLKGKTSTVDSRIRARSRDQWYGYQDGGPYEGIDEDGYAYSYDQNVARQNLASSSYGDSDIGNVGENIGGPRRVIKRGRRVVSKVGANVGQVASNVASNVSHAASNVGSNIAGVGHDVADKAKNVAVGAQSAVAGAAHTVADTAEHLAHDASTLAQNAGRRVGMVARNAGMQGRRVARRAGMQARRVEQGFERELRENPLAFGAVAVALGAAIGLLLPNTQVEDRLIGEKKDLLLDTAKERMQGMAQQAISTVQEKAGELTSNLKPEGSESQSTYQNGLSDQNGVSNGISKHV